jgi:hypothetical protein
MKGNTLCIYKITSLIVTSNGNQSINYTWVSIKEQHRVAPYNTRRPRLALARINGPRCVDQACPNCHVLGVVPKRLDVPSCMEMSTLHCGRGSYIIPIPLLDRCWRPPLTPLGLRKFALKNLLGQPVRLHASQVT